MKLFCSGQIVSVGDPTRKYTKMEKIGQGWANPIYHSVQAIGWVNWESINCVSLGKPLDWKSTWISSDLHCVYDVPVHCIFVFCFDFQHLTKHVCHEIIWHVAICSSFFPSLTFSTHSHIHTHTQGVWYSAHCNGSGHWAGGKNCSYTCVAICFPKLSFLCSQECW